MAESEPNWILMIFYVPDLCLIFFVKLHQLTGILFHNLVPRALCLRLNFTKGLGDTKRLTVLLFPDLSANLNGISDFKGILRDFPDMCW